MTDTIVLGLDGATWDVLEPLLECGRLPNLARLVDDGHSGDLESTFPPITAPAWLSMATGQNPGKTGVYYFLNREDPDSFDFKPLGSDTFRGQSFWDVLSAQGQSVGVFNYPMLYPPYEIDGFMVSGLGSEAEEAITYPRSLFDELDEVTDGYQVKVPYADPKYHGRPEALKRDLLEIVGKREAAIEYLLSEKDPDCFFGIISATDWAQHYFWRFHDDEHALYDPDAGHRDALGEIWGRVDETVGLVADRAAENDANLILVSDHGFGPVNRTFNLNGWLEREGFSYPAEQSLVNRARATYFPYLRRIGEAVVGAVPVLNDIATSIGESIRTSPGEVIDFERSIAFAPRQNLTCGMIYMLTDDPADRRAVGGALESVVDAEPGPETINVYEPSDLYHGPKTELAPDLLFAIDGFRCAVDPRPATTNDVFSEGPPSKARNGGHNERGIIVATGPGIDRGEDLQADIYDVAPTLLSLAGQPIPEEVDGEVLADLLDGRDADGEPPETAPIRTLIDESQQVGRTDDEAVKDRLKDLGYI